MEFLFQKYLMSITSLHLDISTDTILPAWLIDISLPLSVTGLAVIELISERDVEEPVLDNESVQTTDPFKLLIA